MLLFLGNDDYVFEQAASEGLSLSIYDQSVMPLADIVTSVAPNTEVKIRIKKVSLYLWSLHLQSMTAVQNKQSYCAVVK